MENTLRNAYAEVNQILEILGRKYKNKVPRKLLKLFKEQQNEEYKRILEKTKKVEHLQISRNALTIISIINLKINKRKNINKKISEINKTKNNYYLVMKENYKIKEKIIDKNIKEIININQILKNKNNLIKIKIINKIIKKYIKNNYYIIFNINFFIKKLNKNPLRLKNKNYLILENNKNNLLNLYKNKIESKNIYLIIINYYKNNLSKYFYKIILRNKFKKIKIINLI